MPSVTISERQLEVLRLLADGHSNKEIASRLGITTKTVEFHRARLSQLFGTTGMALLVRAAIRAGFVEP